MRSFASNALALAATLALSSLAPVLARAQQPSDVGRLFSHEADVTTTWGDSFRLPLPSEVLSICQPGLSDVRLYDASGREIPWMLDSGARTTFGSGERSIVSAPALEATREREGSPYAPTGFVERYVVASPGRAPARAEWSLAFSTTIPSFVASVRVVELGVDGVERELVATSLYRMPPMRERLRIPVPITSSSNVRVEITSQDGYLEPLLSWEATRARRGPTTMTIPLEIREQSSEGGRTVLVVTRPPGTIADRLRFSTSTSAFARRVEVEGGSSGEIHRVPTVRDAEEREIDVAPFRGATLTITIVDGDSPPLEDLHVEAVLAQPSLVFFEPATLLRFGGGRVRAPRYDLDALAGSWMVDRLLDGSMQPTEATLSPARPSPTWDGGPALAFLHRPGVVAPLADYRSLASLSVREAPEGASRFVLSPAALSALAEDRSDLRIIGDDGRQWPYLVTEHPIESIALTPAAPVRERDETRYTLALPVEYASPTELRLVADAELVARDVRVVGIDARGDEVTIGSGRLGHAPGQDPVMTLSLSGVRVSSLALLVEDGDESPLVFSSVEARVPSSEIFLVAPPGEYRALFGADGVSPPAYDIDRARDLLVAIPPAEAQLGALTPNPAFHEPGLIESAGLQTLALWAVLVLAVLVLGVLTLRASREPEPAEAPPSPPSTPGSGEASP